MNNAIEGMHIDRAIEGMHIDRAIEAGFEISGRPLAICE